MPESRSPVHTGGCQYGAVRYALYAEPTNPHVCHCRMCQKAFGSYFAPLAGVPLADFAWTKGSPFRYTDKDRISLSLGSLDDPSRVVPAKQFGIESRLPFVATIASLPGTRKEDDIPPQDQRKLKSRQHPDRPDEEP